MLVVDDVNSPNLVRNSFENNRRAAWFDRRSGKRTPPLLTIPKLQDHFAIQPANAIGVDQSAFSPMQNMNAPIDISYARFGDIFDPFDEHGP